MVLFPKEKVPYSTWYFFPLVLFPIHQKKLWIKKIEVYGGKYQKSSNILKITLSGSLSNSRGTNFLEGYNQR